MRRAASLSLRSCCAALTKPSLARSRAPSRASRAPRLAPQLVPPPSGEEKGAVPLRRCRHARCRGCRRWISVGCCYDGGAAAAPCSNSVSSIQRESPRPFVLLLFCMHEMHAHKSTCMPVHFESRPFYIMVELSLNVLPQPPLFSFSL